MRHMTKEEFPLLGRIAMGKQVVVKNLMCKFAFLNHATFFIHIDRREYDLRYEITNSIFLGHDSVCVDN